MKGSIRSLRYQEIVVGRTAITLIELLVVLGILGLLAGLIVPAVQSVRASSVRLRCEHQQRQIALALHSYHEQHNSLPPISAGGGDSSCPGARGVAHVFPQLELAPVCDQIAAGVERIPTVLCPADGELDHVSRPISYVFNSSPGKLSGSRFNGPFGGGSQSMAIWNVARLSEITDGTSSTAALSEFSTTRNGGSAAAADANPLRFTWLVTVDPLSAATLADPFSPTGLVELATAADLSIQDCRSGPRNFNPTTDAQFPSWGSPNMIPMYSHWIPPNIPSCNSLGMANTFIRYTEGARSLHRGGVNVAFLDGHVQFINENIDGKVWRALGTRDGGEPEANGALP